MSLRTYLALVLDGQNAELAAAHDELYPERVAVVANGKVVAEHARVLDRDRVVYDWRHYVPLIERKPGALRNGAPFVDLPEPLRQLSRHLLRRAGGESPSSRLSFADLEMDDDTHEVWRGGTAVDLTNTEYKLLRFLLANARRALSKAQILDHVWEYDFGGDANVVETYVSYLRKQLDPLGPPLIQTIRGMGYSLRLPRE